MSRMWDRNDSDNQIDRGYKGNKYIFMSASKRGGARAEHLRKNHRYLQASCVTDF